MRGKHGENSKWLAGEVGLEELFSAPPGSILYGDANVVGVEAGLKQLGEGAESCDCVVSDVTGAVLASVAEHCGSDLGPRCFRADFEGVGELGRDAPHKPILPA